MYQRKRGTSTGGPLLCSDLVAHSPERAVGSAFRGGKKVAKNGSRKRQTDWTENVDETEDEGDCKRVMVVVDQTKESILALRWALLHVVQPLDVITLIYVQPSVTPKQTMCSHPGRNQNFPQSSGTCVAIA
jgi:hypothetical protein